MKTIALSAFWCNWLHDRLEMIDADPYTRPEDAIAEAAGLLAVALAAEDLELLRQVSEGAVLEPLLVTGLPVDAVLPPSPVDGKRVMHKRTYVTEYVNLGIGRLMGLHAIGYHNEKGGDIIHQVCPVQGFETEKSNQGSDYFAFHIEAPHHATPPDFLILNCLRGNPEAATTFVSLIDVLREAPPHVLNTLRDTQFTIRLSPSFGADGTRKVRIVEPDVRRMRLLYRLDLEEMVGDSLETIEALEYLRGACEKHSGAHALAPGEMIVLNNRALLHGRTQFPTKYDGTQRWLQRCYLVHDTMAGIPHDDRWPRVWNGAL